MSSSLASIPSNSSISLSCLVSVRSSDDINYLAVNGDLRAGRRPHDARSAGRKDSIWITVYLDYTPNLGRIQRPLTKRGFLKGRLRMWSVLKIIFRLIYRLRRPQQC